MQARINEHFKTLGNLPFKTEVEFGMASGFAMAIEMLKKPRQCWIVGNGGSAAIASHMAEDYTKNGGIRLMAFNDAAMLSCFANDFGWENVFSAAIDYYARSADLVITISSSGKSENILNAAKKAKEKYCDVITFSGFEPDNPLRQLGDLNFYVPDKSYGNVEITHLSLLHAMLDFICGEEQR